MRKFILLSAVSLFFIPCVTTSAFGEEAHVPAEDVSAGAGSGIDVRVGSDETQPIIDSNIEAANAIIKNLQLLGKQILTADTASDVQATRTGTGVAQAAAKTAVDSQGATIVRENGGVEDALCQAASDSMNMEDLQGNSDKMEDQYVARATKVANSEAGTDSENGLIDFQRKLFERAKQLCSASGNGGANVYCGGDGANKHLTIHTLLGAETLPSDDENNEIPPNNHIQYMDDVLFARVPLSIPPDALEDPNTDVQNLMVEADRLKMEMSVGQQAFSSIRANRAGVPGMKSAEIYKQIMEANGWENGQITEYFDTNGVSVNTMYKALTVGSYGSEFILNLLGGKNDKGLLVVLVKQLMLNNVLQYEQYKLLESIALSSAINIPVNRDGEIKRVNAEIQKLRSGN